MNISRINKLLEENEKIKTKVGDLKRILNLKGNQQQKEEIARIILELKYVFSQNQEEISKLSSIKAGEFANLVCKILNRDNERKYNVLATFLNYPKNSIYQSISKHFKNESKGMFLVVANKKIQENDVVSLEDENVVPIAYLDSYLTHNLADNYTYYVLNQIDINLFESPKYNKVFDYLDGVKTFNLGVANKTPKTNINMLKLRERIKEELGIASVCRTKKVEKQL